MTEYCRTFLSRAILSSTRCLFCFVFFNSHPPLWGVTLRDDEGSSSLRGPRFPFDWCSFRISCSDKRCNTAAESRDISHHLPAILPPVRPPSPKCRLSSKAVGGARCHGTVRHELSAALTDYGHFNNLAFLKSPLQSAVNYFPSQFITSCLLWTCPAFTNCNCLFFWVWGGDYYTRTIISVNHLRTPWGQIWSPVGSRRALNQFLLERFFLLQ